MRGILILGLVGESRAQPRSQGRGEALGCGLPPGPRHRALVEVASRVLKQGICLKGFTEMSTEPM